MADSEVYPGTVALIGEVAEITVHIERLEGVRQAPMESEATSDESWDFTVADEVQRANLHRELGAIVQEHLGEAFKLDPVVVRRRWSVEVLVVVSAAYVVVKTINDVISQLLQAVEYIRQFVGGFVSQFKARVTARPTPLGALAAAITGAGVGGPGFLATASGGNTEAWRILRGWFIPVFLALTGIVGLVFLAAALVKFF